MVHSDFPARSGKAILRSRRKVCFSALDPRPDTIAAFDRFLPMQRLLRASELALLPHTAERRAFRRQRVTVFRDYLRHLGKTIKTVQEGSRDVANEAEGFNILEELLEGFETSAILGGLRLALWLYILRVPSAGELAERMLFALEFSVFRADPLKATT